MAVTFSQAQSTPDDVTHIRKPFAVGLAIVVILFAIGAIFGTQLVAFIQTGIVPSGYVRTTAVVSDSYCTTEDLTFSDLAGHSYTVPYAPLYVGRLCHNDPDSSQKLVAYNPLQPSVNVKIPFQTEQIVVTAILTVGILTVILIASNTVPLISRRARK